MRKYFATIAAIAVVVFLGFASGVSAEEAKGTIADVDVSSRTIILEDGNMYVVEEGVALETLQPGAEVTVSFEVEGDQKVAHEVIPES